MKKLLCMFLILAAFAGCGVSKIPEGESESPKTTKATTKATSDTDDADVNPGAVTTAATTESLLGKTLEALEELLSFEENADIIPQIPKF